MFYNENFYYLLCFRRNPILEKFCSWDIGQNAPTQSDCMIFKATICPKQVCETASFFACWYKFANINWFKFFLVGHGKKWVWLVWSWDSKIDFICRMNRWSFACWVGMVRNGYIQSSHGTLELLELLTVPEKKYGRKWFFCMLVQIRKAKSWFNDFWLGVVKNGYGLLVHKTR